MLHLLVRQDLFLLEQGDPDVPIQLVQLFLEGQYVMVRVDSLVDQIHVVLHRLFESAHRSAENSTGLRALVLDTDLQALLGWVKVLDEITLDLRHDGVGLQLTGQLEVNVEYLEPRISLLCPLLLETVLCHCRLRLIDVDLYQFLCILVLLLRVILHLLCELKVLGYHILTGE